MTGLRSVTSRWVAYRHATALSLDGVDGSERRCGHRDEETGVRADRLRSALSAYETAGYQNPRVRLVGVGTRRADDLASVLARNTQRTGRHFTGRSIDHLTAQTNRVGATSRKFDLTHQP